jgi:hypothetical protein
MARIFSSFARPDAAKEVADMIISSAKRISDENIFKKTIKYCLGAGQSKKLRVRHLARNISLNGTER